MGKKSSITNKNIYLQTREEAGLTRAQASELMGYVSESRIEKIESEKATAHPEDVVAMSKAYKKPSLCNYYCSHECAIGQEQVPEIKEQTLSEIVLGMLSALNTLNKDKDRLIDITADGVISDDELPDFVRIQEQLDNMSMTLDAMKLWVENTIASGAIDKSKLDSYKKA